MPVKKKAAVKKKPTSKKVVKASTKKKPAAKARKKAAVQRKVTITVTQSLPGVYRTGRKFDGIFSHPRFVPVIAVALFAGTIASIFGVLGSSAAPSVGNCFIQEDGRYRLVDETGTLTDKVIPMRDKTPYVQELLCEF